MPGRQSSPVIHLRGEQSAGQLALVELVIAAGAPGPPLHIHPGHAEGFYILEGELVFKVRDRLVTGRAGSFLFAPAGVPHTFANPGQSDARLLVTCNPAGFERWFERPAGGTSAETPPDSVAVGPPIGGPTENQPAGSSEA
jgi:quercetin dioxygenase-like cupin family protein